jgi:hypothetical protein
MSSSDYFHPEFGGGTFLQNVGSYKNQTASHPKEALSIGHEIYMVYYST